MGKTYRSKKRQFDDDDYGNDYKSNTKKKFKSFRQERNRKRQSKEYDETVDE